MKMSKRGRVLEFQQRVTSKEEGVENCLPILEKRVEKIKSLLDIKGVNLKVSEPHLINLKNTMKNFYIDMANKTNDQKQKEKFLKESKKEHIQYEVNFWVNKNTTTVTWNDIYELVNSVKAVPYNFR